MRVLRVDPDLDVAPPPEPSAERTTLVPEISNNLPAAPPLAVRPVEDPEWVMRN